MAQPSNKTRQPAPPPATNATPAKHSKDSADEFRAKPDLDGKNDSGPDPEVHAAKIPPQ